MLRGDSAVYAVDLFVDVLVNDDAHSYGVYDRDEFAAGRDDALISAAEAEGAEQGLAELVELIEQGRLMAFLAEVYPFTPSEAPAALAERRVPLEQVPHLQPGLRATWA